MNVDYRLFRLQREHVAVTTSEVLWQFSLECPIKSTCAIERTVLLRG